jgi:hypothetical protein
MVRHPGAVILTRHRTTSTPEVSMSRFFIASFALLALAASPVRLMAETIEEEHPRLERSIHELEETIKFLEAAPHDFGGHREQAIHDCREALRQLREALNFARHHQ